MIANIEIEPFNALLTNFGVVGALVWYMWYNTSSTMPALVHDHRKAMERVTELFTESLAEERRARKEELGELKSWIREEARCDYNRDRIGSQQRDA